MRTKRADIALHVKNGGKDTVRATMVGPYLAFHRNHITRRHWDRRDGYAITHVPSGMRVCSTDTAYEARQKTLALASLDVDWSVSSPEKGLSKVNRDAILQIIRSTHPRYCDRKYVESPDNPILTRTERVLRRKALEYAVGRAIFCPKCQAILDARRAVLLTGPDSASVACAPCFDSAAAQLTGGNRPLRMREGWEIDDGRDLVG